MSLAPPLSLVKQVVSQISPSSCCRVERVEEGVSTYVHRIHQANNVFYLRILPEEHASFVPEAQVHQQLLARSVKVPEIIYVEDNNELLQCSIMVTTEIKGTHCGDCSSANSLQTILFEAGKDLAIINSIPVEGFGWIRRNGNKFTLLEAEHPTLRAFVYEHLESDLAELAHIVLPEKDISAIHAILKRYDNLLDEDRSWLAHGDFDMTHIYQKQGRYSGIIDFGEIRGTHALYDLSHFRVHDGEMLPILLFPYLLEGYYEMTALPHDYEQRIVLTSLLITIRTLARAMKRHPQSFQEHHALKVLKRDVQALLA